ncbi:MAG: N-acetyltransferase [Gammaproteobacteria bacterium]|nr:N-acetyltransferase [Gammaproteobacteria bacterium]
MQVCDSLEAVGADEWNRLAGYDEPFLSHEFLVALERHGCVGKAFGWRPTHLLARDRDGALSGAMPLYIKTNSYGEFVFDWSWASAYERNGLEYYPKLVTAVPYTPITGPRMLVRTDAKASRVKDRLIESAVALAKERGFTGAHWLFTDPADTERLLAHDLMLRLGVQYHWHNDGYRDFNHFLDGFQSRKRKKIKRERARMPEQSIVLNIVHGDQAGERLWKTVHRFYTDTFDRKWGVPTLNLGFFKEIGRTMGARVVLVMAELDSNPVACAINFRSDNALYGRFWGCDQAFHSLHFEACYYQGIDYCIRHGLQRFEPGAQGEHKIWRGFLPTRTWSAHWIAQPQFRVALTDFCRREQAAMEQEYQALWTLSPFRPEAVPPTHAPPAS